MQSHYSGPLTLGFNIWQWIVFIKKECHRIKRKKMSLSNKLNHCEREPEKDGEDGWNKRQEFRNFYGNLNAHRGDKKWI